MTSFFFYGTLMHSDVLSTVIGNAGEHLTFRPAVLKGWARFKVEGEDYPALVRSTSPKASVRGTLVDGLTSDDVDRLSAFEGPEYAIAPLAVDAFGPAQTRESGGSIDVLGELPQDLRGQRVEARAYVWIAGEHLLESEPWECVLLPGRPLGCFAHFASEKLHLWTSPSSPSIEPPAFGHGLLKYWSFSPGYVNLNHGSYGSTPLPVQKYCRELRLQVENSPDKFMRRDYLPLLTEVRESLASLTHARADDVVIVPNASHGVQTVVNNLVWKDGDIIVAFSTSYGAILQILRYTCDRAKSSGLDVKLVLIDLEFPMTHEEIIRRTEAVLKTNSGKAGDETSTGGRIKMIVIDGISSIPGVVMPWRQLSALARRYGVLSLVDGAHLIGQVEVDLSDDMCCDFLVTNMHKWLYAQRPAAMLWVPVRNQHLVRSSFPSSFDYESSLYPGTGKGPWNFVKQFDWTGTIDWVPFLSVTPALAFRTFLGGERRINAYCHDLAVKGGQRMKDLFEAGSGQSIAIMESAKAELTANLVTIQLPISDVPVEDGKAVQRFLEDELLANNCFAACAKHGERWWVRCSAQVWLELDDFDYVAKGRASREVFSVEKNIEQATLTTIAEGKMITGDLGGKASTTEFTNAILARIK